MSNSSPLDVLAARIDMAGGWCPVQVLGFSYSVDAYFYFRARGDGWSLAIGGETEEENDEIWMGDRPGYYQEEGWGAPGGFDAGYMPMEEAVRILQHHLQVFARQQMLRNSLRWALSAKSPRAKQIIADAFVLQWRSVNPPPSPGDR